MGELSKRLLDALILPVAVAGIAFIHSSLIQEPRWTMEDVLFLDSIFWVVIAIVGILVCKMAVGEAEAADADNYIRNIWLVSSSWIFAAIVFLAVMAGSHDGVTKVVSGLVTILLVVVGISAVNTERVRLPLKRPWFWSSVLVPAGLVAAFYASVEGRTIRPAIAILFVTLFIHAIWRFASWPRMEGDSVEEGSLPSSE